MHVFFFVRILAYEYINTISTYHKCWQKSYPQQKVDLPRELPIKSAFYRPSYGIVMHTLWHREHARGTIKAIPRRCSIISSYFVTFVATFCWRCDTPYWGCRLYFFWEFPSSIVAYVGIKRPMSVALQHTSLFVSCHYIPWASYQIRKIAGCACAGNAGNVSPSIVS